MCRRKSGIDTAIGVQSDDLKGIRTLWLWWRVLAAIEIRSAIHGVHITTIVLSHRNAAWIQAGSEAERRIQCAGPSQTDQMRHWLSIEMSERARRIEFTGFRKGDSVDVTIEPLTKAIGHAPICM